MSFDLKSFISGNIGGYVKDIVLNWALERFLTPERVQQVFIMACDKALAVAAKTDNSIDDLLIKTTRDGVLLNWDEWQESIPTLLGLIAIPEGDELFYELKEE